MDSKGGFKIVGKADNDHYPRPDADPDLGATGFYYITPSEDDSLSGRRVYTRLFILPAYILRELLKGVILSTAVFSLILMAVFSGQVMKDGVGAMTLIRVMPNFIPLICPFVLPLGIITGILICYSRLSKDNEILAAYAGGINPFWLMLPALATSVLAIFITLTLNEVALMPAILNIEKMVVDDQANILRRMITRPGNITVQTGSEYVAMSKLDASRDPFGRASLDITRFGSVPPHEQVDANFAWDPKYPYPAKRIVARDHEMRDFTQSADDLTMKMQVSKPIFEDLHPVDINRTFIASGESGEERIVLNDKPGSSINAGRTVFWPILQLSVTRSRAEEEIRKLQSLDMDSLSESQQSSAQYMLMRQEDVVLNRTSEINMRLALCFSCLAFAILGIPLGMRTRGTLVSSFVWGIVTAGVYFLALKSAESQVARGLLPYWAIWIPDILVVVVGIVLWFLNTRRS